MDTTYLGKLVMSHLMHLNFNKKKKKKTTEKLESDRIRNNMSITFKVFL